MTLLTQNSSQYRHLMIDLGAVLYAIDLRRSVAAFASLSGRPPEELAALLQDPIFLRLERGEISPAAFRQGLRGQLSLSATDAEIDAAWNALLLGVIPGREALVARLAQRFDVVLLSNTNQIHYDALAGECAPLFAQFSACHFSFRMGMRKPDAGIYRRVLDTHGWKAEETLLIDDGEANVLGAQALGMGGLLFTSEADWASWRG